MWIVGMSGNGTLPLSTSLRRVPQFASSWILPLICVQLWDKACGNKNKQRRPTTVLSKRPIILCCTKVGGVIVLILHTTAGNIPRINKEIYQITINLFPRINYGRVFLLCHECMPINLITLKLIARDLIDGESNVSLIKDISYMFSIYIQIF